MNPVHRSIRRAIGARRRFSQLDDGRPGFAVVTAVDPDAGEATVELADGTTTTIYAQNGNLPAPGDQVPLLRNGGDIIPTTPGVLTPGGRLIGVKANGAGIDIGEGPTEFGDQWRIALYTGDPNETEPGYVTWAPWGVSVRSPVGSDFLQPHAKVEVGADLAGDDTWVNLEGKRLTLAFDDPVLVNGMDVTKPALRITRRGAAQSVPSATPTNLIPTESIVSNPIPATTTPSVAVDYTTGAHTPAEPGWYIVSAWASLSAGGGPFYALLAIDCPDGSVPLDEGEHHGGALGTNLRGTSDPIWFDGVTDSVTAAVLHGMGSDKAIQMERMTVRRYSA